MHEELLEISKLLLDRLREDYSASVFNVWLSSLKMKELTDEEAVLTIDNEFKKNIVEKKHSEKLTEVISEILGFPVHIKFEIESKEDGFSIPSFPEKTEPQENTVISDIKPATPLIPQIIESKNIVEEYTFDNFIVGDSNKFAHAACTAVAAMPFETYNPLFIHGSSGLGKTHLLYAITNELKKNHPSITIMFKKCEDFTNELIDSLKAGNTAAFREKFRAVDVLLIDDVQFLSDKTSTQEEFFHTFNELYENRKQIILTSDRPPKDIQHLAERLRNRFEWGLIADIQKPNIELRTAIIRKKLESYKVTMPEEVINFLATSIHSNIRQIEGSIKKIIAISRMTGSPITIDMSRRAIADILANSVSTSDMIEHIFSLVASRYKITAEEIKGKKRDSSISNARHICIYLIRQMNELSLKQIGDIFSKDHTTIIASCKKVRNEMDTNEEKKQEIEGLMKELGIQ